MEESIQWRIFYADGSAFGHEQGSWEDAPLDGVVLVAVRRGDRVEYLTGSDHYAKLDEETIANLDELGPTMRQYDKWIKHGVWTGHRNFERIRERALEEFKRQA